MTDNFMQNIQNQLLDDLESGTELNLGFKGNQHTDTILSNMDPEDIPVDLKWVAFIYNGKPRFGLDLGPDERYTQNHNAVMCVEGYKIFLKNKMVGLRQVNLK